MKNLIIRPIAPMQNSTLGGAQFYGADRLLYSVRADPDSHSEAPVELHVGSRGNCCMLDMPIEGAKALIVCLTTAIRLRQVLQSSRHRRFSWTRMAHWEPPEVSQTGVARALGMSSRGNTFPSFIASQAMSEAISGELRQKLQNPVIFQWRARRRRTAARNRKWV